MVVLGTQALAPLIAVYGVLVLPFGWGWAALVWGYAIAWFLFADPVKLLAHRILDPAHAAAGPEPKIPSVLISKVSERSYKPQEWKAAAKVARYEPGRRSRGDETELASGRAEGSKT